MPSVEVSPYPTVTQAPRMCRALTPTAATSPAEGLRLVACMGHPLLPESVSDVAPFSGLPTSTLHRWKQRASCQIIQEPCGLIPPDQILCVVVL